MKQYHTEFQILNDYIRSRRLRHTPQRGAVLSVFLAIEGHVCVEELYQHVRRRFPGIGYTTVYRTMKLLAECGLCRAIDFGDGIERYEHQYGHAHHDHLICTRCGDQIEVVNADIENLQELLAHNEGFVLVSHSLQIFGICKQCMKRSPVLSAGKQGP
jgi:Fur family transcriptional regulator, ferric uptake regulator